MCNLKSKVVLSWVFILFLLCSINEVSFALLSRGHEILIVKGLQIQGLCSPQMWGGNWPPEPPVQEPNMPHFLESNFTGLNLLGNAYTEMYFGEMPDIQWGRWSDLESSLRTEELPYLPTMVCFSYPDESDINDPNVREDAIDWFADTKANYPGVITYFNQFGGQKTLAELQDFVEYCEPDMVCFDVYPFEGPYLSTYSGAYYYSSLYKYRTLGLGGHDGTGDEPIPYAMYLQTYARESHTPSESEMRLNMFSALTFGYKVMMAFTYTSFWDGGATPSILFTGLDDSSPTAKFDEMAKINREARNLGSTLVRLLSTDLGVVKGIHAIDGGVEENNVPVKVWNANDPNNDPYITDINAMYVEHPTVRGDVFVGYFKPLLESDDGPDYEDEIYFMIFNGQCDPTEDSNQTRHDIRIDFDFGSSGITSLLRLNRDTGRVETVALTSDGGSIYHLDLTLPGGTADLFKFNTGAFFVRNSVMLDENFTRDFDEWNKLDTVGSSGTVAVNLTDSNELRVDLTNCDRFRFQGAGSKKRYTFPEGGTLIVDFYGTNNNSPMDSSHSWPFWLVSANDYSSNGYVSSGPSNSVGIRGADAYTNDYAYWKGSGSDTYTSLGTTETLGAFKHVIVTIDANNVKLYIEDGYYENLVTPVAVATVATSSVFTTDQLKDGLYVYILNGRDTTWFSGMTSDVFDGVKVYWTWKKLLLEDNFSNDLSLWNKLDTAGSGTVAVNLSGSGELKVDLTNCDRFRFQGVVSKNRFTYPEGGALIVDYYGTNHMTTMDSSHSWPFWLVSANDYSSNGYVTSGPSNSIGLRGVDAYTNDYSYWKGLSSDTYTNLGTTETSNAYKHIIVKIEDDYSRVYIEDDYYENLLDPTPVLTVATSSIFSAAQLEAGLYVYVLNGRDTSWFTGTTSETFNGIRVLHVGPDELLK